MSELKIIKGLGEKTLTLLSNEAIFSCEDLISRYPKRYESKFLSRSIDLNDSKYHYIEGIVTSDANLVYTRANLTIISFDGNFDGITLSVRIFNQPFIMSMIKKDTKIVVYGKKNPHQKTIVCSKLVLRKYFDEMIQPIYKIPNISDKNYHKFVKDCLEKSNYSKDILPEEIIDKYRFYSKKDFLQAIHIPKDKTNLYQAIRRLKYQELLFYQLKVQISKKINTETTGTIKTYDIKPIKAWIETLPFTLTLSQQKVTNEIYRDLKSHHVMHRMLQGDTGSGKTIVAFLAIYATITAKFQAAMMTPTEILANQHYQTLKPYFDQIGYKIELLTGSTSKQMRQQILNRLKNGDIDLLIGTHTLFNKDITYHKLGLVITDEQHRFGVKQRIAFKEKGNNPDILYLSATPIPRTLAMTVFGDMEISTLDEKPSITSYILTKVVTSKDKEIVRKSIEETLHKKEQIFLIAPLIDDLETSSIQGIKTIHKSLKKRFPNASIDTLHGKRTTEEKLNILNDFKNGSIDILVSTTVVEVGIHVPNATLMIIYHAERFGYAQLHQLRGRLGRGNKPGICYLNTHGDEETFERLKVLETVYDGFKLSEEDMIIRGFGDLSGVMQSGYFSFEYADIKTDLEMLKYARNDAIDIIDTYYKTGKYQGLITKIKKQIGA